MERHVAHSALVRMFSGQASGPEVETTVPHLVRCRRCWDGAARVVADLESEGLLAPSDDARNAVLVLLEQEQRQALCRLLARGRWTELRRLPVRQQRDRIEADPALRTVEMFSTLAAEAASTSREDPLLGEETALLAHALAGALPADHYPEPFRNDLQGEALALVANCRRLAGDWRGSAAAFGAAPSPARDRRAGTRGPSALAPGVPRVGYGPPGRPWSCWLAPPCSIAGHRTSTRSRPTLGRRTRLLSGYLEALLLDAFGHARDSEKAFRSAIAGLMDAELYKDAFLIRLTHFETLFRRGVLGRAARVCEEAIEDIEQAGTGSHSQMTELWRGLLALCSAGRLTDHQFVMARQYLIRHWNVPARRAPLERCDRISVVSVPSSAARKPDVMVPATPGLRLVASGEPGSGREGKSGQLSAGSAGAVTDLVQESYEGAMERYDRDLIAAGLARCGGRVRETSRLLGISRNTLRGKLRKYGLMAGEDPIGQGAPAAAQPAGRGLPGETGSSRC